MEPLPCAIITPLSKVGVHPLPCWVLTRQHAPLASSDDQVKNGIDHASHLQCSWMTSWLGRRDQFFDTIPLTVSQIAWIQLVFLHIPSVSRPSPLFKQALRYPGENAVFSDKGGTELKKQKRFQCHAILSEKPGVLTAPPVVANYLGNRDYFNVSSG